MKVRTLVTQRLYFGLDAVQLRAAAGRAAARIVGLSPDRARVSAVNLRQDFAVDTIEGQALVNELVSEGLLKLDSEQHGDYRLTDRFLEFAAARVVDPLPRSRAKLLLAEACELAERINDEWLHNRIEIVAIATYGEYMRRDDKIAELKLGIVVRSREPTWRARFGRMTTKAQGATEIRNAFRELSSFVRVRLVTEMAILPRPFSVIYQLDLG